MLELYSVKFRNKRKLVSTISLFFLTFVSDELKLDDGGLHFDSILQQGNKVFIVGCNIMGILIVEHHRRLWHRIMF